MENTVSMAHSHYSHVRYVRYLKHCTVKTAHLKKKHRQTSSRKKTHIAIHRQDTPVVCHQPRDDVDACIVSGIPSESNHSVMSAYDWLRRPNYILCMVFRSHSHSQPVIGFWGCHFGSFEMWVGWKTEKPTGRKIIHKQHIVFCHMQQNTTQLQVPKKVQNKSR